MLTFVRAPATAKWPTIQPSICYLKEDNWNDYGYQTLFELGVATADGKLHEIGHVKIITADMELGRVAVPSRFHQLGKQFCSLGQDQNYYEQLAALPDGIGLEILSALRDCVADSTIWRRFRTQKAVEISLLRGVSSSSVERSFLDALRGQLPSTAFRFSFDVQRPAKAPPLRLEVNVVPHSSPPTNVHVLIGRNGVGKTRMLAGLSDAITAASRNNAFGIAGAVAFAGETAESGRFVNLVAVAFSAFDRFAPIDAASIGGDVRYSYVGLKRVADNEQTAHFKDPQELSAEFGAALNSCLTGPRRSRWLQTLRILNADPGFADLELDRLSDEEAKAFGVETFNKLSSGHKLVLLTAARLVELVDERTLVLIDEPESHLHPPLLSSFVRSLSHLLVLRNGVAIIATHSPVVLQEVPRSCVWVLRRNGEFVSAERPRIETFGENVGTLTHEVFQLEVTQSGFHTLLADAANSLGYQEIIEKFQGQLGAEARAIARALTSTRRDPHA